MVRRRLSPRTSVSDQGDSTALSLQIRSQCANAGPLSLHLLRCCGEAQTCAGRPRRSLQLPAAAAACCHSVCGRCPESTGASSFPCRSRSSLGRPTSRGQDLRNRVANRIARPSLVSMSTRGTRRLRGALASTLHSHPDGPSPASHRSAAPSRCAKPPRQRHPLRSREQQRTLIDDARTPDTDPPPPPPPSDADLSGRRKNDQRWLEYSRRWPRRRRWISTAASPHRCLRHAWSRISVCGPRPRTVGPPILPLCPVAPQPQSFVVPLHRPSPAPAETRQWRQRRCCVSWRSHSSTAVELKSKDDLLAEQ